MGAIIFNIAESLKISAFNILEQPIKMIMENEVEAFEKLSLINKIFKVVSIDKYQEEFRSRTAMGGFKPAEDLEKPNLADFGEGYKKTYKTQIWMSSFVVSKQTIEDNRMMDISADAVGFIKSYGRSREDYAMAMVAGALSGSCTYEGKVFDCKGFDTTDGTIDGTDQTYFHSGHIGANNAAVVQSNKFYVKTGANVGINLASTGAHERLLRTIGKVQTAMQNYTDDNGNPIMCDPDTIVLATNNYALKDTLLTGLKTQFTSAMGDNGVNLQYGNWNVLLTPYLNNKSGFAEADQAFIVMDSKRNRESIGFLWLDRTPLEITAYVDNSNYANIWSGRARFQAGFGDFRVASYVCTGASPSYADYNANATAISEYLA